MSGQQRGDVIAPDHPRITPTHTHAVFAKVTLHTHQSHRAYVEPKVIALARTLHS